MIDKETLKDYARLSNLKPWQQEKHYIQALILNSLTEIPLVFKGGTYLWFFHNLLRFSEDLDFTAVDEIREKLPQEVGRDLELLGVENNVKVINNSMTGLSFRISARGPLNTSEKDLCHVYVEISKRGDLVRKPLQFKLDFPAYRIPIKVINGMCLDEIGSEKVRAVLTRNKSRDLYDLYHLISDKDIRFNISLINKKLDYYGKGFSEDEFIQKIKNFEKIYAKEMGQLVFGELPEFKKISSTVKDWVE